MFYQGNFVGPYFGLIVTFALGFKARVDHFADPRIHIWYGTWLYRCQHGNRTFSIHLLADVSTSTGRGSGLKPTTVRLASTALYTIWPLRLNKEIFTIC